MYQNQQQQNLEADVLIQKIESTFINGSQKFTLTTDKGKFTFFDTKVDGNQTVAFKQFNQFRFKIGDMVRVSYITKESGMNPHTQRPYVNNNIMKFVTVDQNTPVTPPAPYQVQMNGSIGNQVQQVPRWNAPVNTQYHAQTEIPMEIPTINLNEDIPTPGYNEKEERIMDLTLRVQALEDSLKKVNQVVSGHGTLLTNLRGEKAFELHTSFPVTDVPKPYIPEDDISVADVDQYFNPNN